VIVISIVTEAGAVIGGLVSAKVLVVGRRLTTVGLGKPVPHVGQVELLIHTLYHIPVHVVDCIWARAWAAAPADDVSAELSAGAGHTVMPC